jgi:hypothetical protein
MMTLRPIQPLLTVGLALLGSLALPDRASAGFLPPHRQAVRALPAEKIERSLCRPWLPYLADFAEVSEYLRSAVTTQRGFLADFCSDAGGEGASVPSDGRTPPDILGRYLCCLGAQLGILAGLTPGSVPAGGAANGPPPDGPHFPLVGLLADASIGPEQTATWAFSLDPARACSPYVGRLFRPPRWAAR